MGNSRNGRLDMISSSKMYQNVCAVYKYQFEMLINSPYHVVKVMLGGVGLYSSTKDYLTFLRHLLLVKGKPRLCSAFPNVTAETRM